MLWFFDRDAERVSVETMYDSEAGKFVVVVRWPDGRRQTERFDNQETCRTWLIDFEHRLDDDHFARSGPPIILPYGWGKKDI